MRCPSRRYRNIPEHTGSVGSKKPTERTPLGGFEVGSSSVDPAEHTGAKKTPVCSALRLDAPLAREGNPA